MKNKHIVRWVVQFLLVCITIFTILTFYTYDILDLTLRKIITVVLISANCIYNHWHGMRSGVEICEKSESYIREIEKNRLDKAIDMILEEKKKNRDYERK